VCKFFVRICLALLTKTVDHRLTLLIGSTQKKQGCSPFSIFSKTTGPIGMDLGRNVHLMVL
jgi:hypothetical protein